MSEEEQIPGIDFALEGTIVNGGALDSVATRVELSNAKYPPFSIQGPLNYPIPLLTIRTGATKDDPEGFAVTIVDPNSPCALLNQAHGTIYYHLHLHRCNVLTLLGR